MLFVHASSRKKHLVMATPSFSPSTPVLFCQSVSSRNVVTHHATPMMRTRAVSRRDLCRITLSAAAGALVLPMVTNAASQKRPDFITDESGISYYDIKTGNGAYPQDGDFVTVDYVAFLSNGKAFDTRKNFVFQMGQRQVIPGLEAALQGMRTGGERNAVIPPSLAYGNRGVCLQEGSECLVQPGETLGYQLTLTRVAIPPT